MMSDAPGTIPASDPIGPSQVIRAFAEHQVDFVVCGGVACVLHGVARVTNDVDLAIALTDENIDNALKAVRQVGFRPRIPEPLEALLDPNRREAWVREKNAKVFTLISDQTPLQIDLFLEYPIPYDELKSRSRVMTSGDLSFHVSTKEDLIAAKRFVVPMRTVDQRDIEDLQELIERERNGQ
jgi:hypothetical protein